MTLFVVAMLALWTITEIRGWRRGLKTATAAAATAKATAAFTTRTAVAVTTAAAAKAAFAARRTITEITARRTITKVAARRTRCALWGFSGHFDVDCLWAFATRVRFRVELDLLSVHQSRKSGPLHSRDVDEYVGAA